MLFGKKKAPIIGKPPYDYELDTSRTPILYHYCSTSTFLSIIENRSIWMSDINTMNDYGEVHWAYDQFIVAVNNILDVVDREFIDHVDKIISTAQTRVLQLSASLSNSADVLSQWRAYADDGAGVAIGFSAVEMKKLSLRIGQIIYNQEDQVKHFETMLLSLYEVYSETDENEQIAFLLETVGQMALDLALMKNPAFQEEGEVRLIRATNVIQQESGWSLQDAGGTGDKHSRRKLPIKFRSAQNGGIISYIELPLSGLGSSLIKEVIIGPKSPNNGVEISMALTAAGYSDVKISPSKATYR